MEITKGKSGRFDNPEGKPGLIGYARTSSRSQNEDSQIDELVAAGCSVIFVDHGASGKLASRPQWDACLVFLRKGDTLVITRLSRAARSVQNLLEVVNGTRGSNREDGLRPRGINLVVLKMSMGDDGQQAIDTRTAVGRFMFNIFAAMDEFQRELIVDGTMEGLSSARARGRVGGRKPKLTDDDLEHARLLLDTINPGTGFKYTLSETAKKVGGGVDTRTLTRALDPARREKHRTEQNLRYQSKKGS